MIHIDHYRSRLVHISFAFDDVSDVSNASNVRSPDARYARYLAGKTGWDLRDQQQVVHKLRRIGCVHPRALQVNIKTGILNKQLKKHKFLPFGEKSMEILEGWASLYAASHSLG